MVETTDAALRDALIVALDGTPEEIKAWGAELTGTATWVKIGMTNYYVEGPALVSFFKERGFRIFLDLKLHDIPHQIRGAAYQLARLGVDLFTIHASGGAPMVAAAVEGARAGAHDVGLPVPAVIAVTLLTSIDAHELQHLGVAESPQEHVTRLARLAGGAGVDGVVCSPLEAAVARRELGPDAWVVTPGVRPAGSPGDDQLRAATPAAALRAGASHLVVGRPITRAIDRCIAYEAVLNEMREGICA